MNFGTLTMGKGASGLVVHRVRDADKIHNFLIETSEGH